MIHFMRGSGVLIATAVALFSLAPSVHAFFPVRFPRPFFRGTPSFDPRVRAVNFRAGSVNSRVSPLRADIFRDRVDLFRDRTALSQGRAALVRDRRSNNQSAVMQDLANLRAIRADIRMDRADLSFDRGRLRSMNAFGNYHMNTGYGGDGGGYGGGGYGGGYGGGSSMAPSDVPDIVVRPQRQTEEPVNFLDVLNLPNSEGHIAWPLGLRVLPPGPESRQLRRQIEGLLQVAATGQSNPQVIKEIGRAVDKLRMLLADVGARDRLAPSTVAEAAGFLNRLEDALPLLQADAALSTITIHIADDTFQPATTHVQAGMAVRWVNNGKHAHTVTAKDGSWDSGDLAPGATYRMTFAKPGTVGYFCRHHAKEMQGKVVVVDSLAAADVGPSAD